MEVLLLSKDQRNAQQVSYLFMFLLVMYCTSFCKYLTNAFTVTAEPGEYHLLKLFHDEASTINDISDVGFQVGTTGTRSKIFNEIVLKDNHLLNNVT